MVTEITLPRSHTGTTRTLWWGTREARYTTFNKEVIQEVSQCRNSRSQLLCELYMDVFAELSPRGSLVIQEIFT